MKNPAWFVCVLLSARCLLTGVHAAETGVPLTGTYRDTSLPVEQRVQDLLKRMTVDEKVGQMNQRLFGWQGFKRDGDKIELTSVLLDEAKHWGGIGAVYGFLRADPWSGMTAETGIPVARRVEMLNRAQEAIMASSRFRIPAFFSAEAPHGHMAIGGTILPTSIGVGSTWNPTLYQEAAAAVAAEVRLSGEHLALLSTLDIVRDPRWGRTEECFSEDPVLAAAMNRAVTLGTQGEKSGDLARPDRAVAVLKCFAAQGAVVGGHNGSTANIGPRELREIHLPAAEAGVRAGALGIMIAYNEIDGIPCCSNPELVRGILHREWGYRGFTVGDGFAVDNLRRQTGTIEAAAVAGVRAGIDLSLWDESYRTLGDSVRAGRLDEREIDRAVANILRVKFQMGLFEHPLTDPNPALLEAARARTREVNIRLARESLVLLRNEGGVLPFKKGLKRVAIIGPNADNVYAQLGDYTPPQQEGETTTVLAGVRALLGAQTEVVHALGCTNRGMDRSQIPAAVELAKSADATILVLGGSSNRYLGTSYAAEGAAKVDQSAKEMDTGEGVDLANLELGGVQLELAQALRTAGVSLAVVLIQGRPYSISWLAENCPAILCGWYPGQAGGRAIAEALFGDVNPSGRLPVSVPRSSGQLPVYYNHKLRGDDPYYDMKGSALYSFGYGLSYTTFALSELRLSADTATARDLEAGGNVTVTVDVANTGSVAGTETVQIYVRGVESIITRRVRELKLFTKVALQPGEKQTLTFRLGRPELGVWGPDMAFVVGPGLNEIFAQGGDGKALSAKLRIN